MQHTQDSPPDKPAHPVLILIRGLPGSGKSHLAEALRQALGPELVVSLDPDAVDMQSTAYQAHTAALTAEGVDPALHLYRFSRAQAYDGISAHKIIIWNQPFTNPDIFDKMVDRLKTHAEKADTTLPILVVEMNIDPVAAKTRVDARKQAGGHGPSDNTFSRFTREYQSVADKGYTTVNIRGDDEVSASVIAVTQALQKLLA